MKLKVQVKNFFFSFPPDQEFYFSVNEKREEQKNNKKNRKGTEKNK